MKTNLPGIFAAWDVTTGSCYFKQLITAASEWAIAAESAFKYLEKSS
jgi:thioredoxin reductase